MNILDLIPLERIQPIRDSMKCLKKIKNSHNINVVYAWIAYYCDKLTVKDCVIR